VGIGTVDGYVLLRCRGCGVRFHPRTGATLAYDAGYFGRHGEAGPGYSNYETIAWYPKRVYQELRSALLQRFPSRGRLLEVGCATGPFVEAAREDGWDAEGIDPAAAAVAVGAERGLPLRAVSLEDAGYSQADRFQVIVMLHMLEHLADPAATLREARRVVAPDGCLVIEVPNLGSAEARLRGLRWSALTPPEHLTYFDRRSLARLLDATGWRVIVSATPTSAELAAERVGDGGTRVGSVAARVLRLASRLGLFHLVSAAGLGGSLRVTAVPA
jgi:2-polyprenyl-3-methyl-5-hydroxy-6-metoxy-1,4-benzoquinol methylase